MSEEKFLELSIKFLGDELTAIELEEFGKYLKEDEYKQKFDTISAKWNKAAESLETSDFDAEEGFKNFIKKIRSVETKQNYQKNSPKFYNLFQNPTFLGIAASIVLILMITTVLFNFTSIFDTNEVIAKWHEKTTKLGEKSSLTFQDGTRIVLNADSKLKYLVNSNDSQREVYLEGEAYFDVAHDTSRPFIIHSNNISTTVLGTKFNISAFPNENKISISLVEGKVQVSEGEKGRDDKKIMLNPGQQLVYEKDKNINTVQQFDVESVVGWKDNILVFNGETLSNVFTKLERAYGIQFELEEDNFKNYSVTANFRNAAFITILHAIKKLTELDYMTEKDSNVITKVVYYKK